MATALAAREVYKGFGAGPRRQLILRGVSLAVAAGETVFLVGPSGSGKTTLLSILGCILTPDRGSVQVMGQEVAALRPSQQAAFRRQRIGFVFQSFNLFPTLSALDNVRLALAMQRLSLRTASLRATELLEQVGLGSRMQLRPAQLSTGECQRVAVARALAAGPAILLADEPTAALDAENGQAVMRLLRRLVHERGGTLVIVTHDERIYPFADRILRLENENLTPGVEAMKFTAILIIGLAIFAGIGTQMALNYTAPPAKVSRPQPLAYLPDMVTADGVLEGAAPEIAIRPEIVATIVALPHRENQEVAKGCLLVELTSDTQKQQVALCQSHLAEAKAQLERLHNGARPEKRKAAASLESSRHAVFLLSKANWERSQKLFNEKATSAEQRDLHYFLMLKAQADLEEATAERTLIEAPARADDLAAAAARVAAAEANLGLAKAELAKTRLLAPIAGHILTVYAEPGESAGPAKPILLMADFSKRRMRAFIEELDAPRVKVGQAATVTLDGLPGSEFPGTVALIMPRMGKRSLHTDGPKEYKDVYFREVLIDLPTDPELIPNARVKARIHVNKSLP